MGGGCDIVVWWGEIVLEDSVGFIFLCIWNDVFGIIVDVILVFWWGDLVFI